MGLPRKGELPFVLGFASASIWFYMHEQPWPAMLIALLLVPWATGRPFMYGSIIASVLTAFPPFYGQGGLAVGAVGIGIVISAYRLSSGSI